MEKRLRRLLQGFGEKDPNLPQLLEEDPNLQKSINVDAWFDVLAFQPAQATFGLASGGTTGRGLGLGFVELIPVADSDYIYAAIGEELGLFGGLLLIFALITFVSAGVRTALDARDMFSKLCAVGLDGVYRISGSGQYGRHHAGFADDRNYSAVCQSRRIQFDYEFCDARNAYGFFASQRS